MLLYFGRLGQCDGGRKGVVGVLALEVPYKPACCGIVVFFILKDLDCGLVCPTIYRWHF